MKTDRTSKAYWEGLKAGLAWDLDGFKSTEEILLDTEGWDDSTINAIGSEKFYELIGINQNECGEACWIQACHDFNRGCYDGACAPQSERTGLPPYNEEV